MVDKCSCKNKCSSNKQGLEYVTKNSFPKKLLVATSVVVILAMSLRSTEAAAIEHRRHKLHDMTKLTKDAVRPIPHMQHRKRHQGQVRTTKEPGSRRRTRYELYESEWKKIDNKFKYTRHNFKDRREVLTEPAAYGDGMPDWLPKTNFVDIHDRNSRFSRNQRLSDAAKSRKKFDFLIKKLYKSLLGYREVFKTFLQVKVITPDRQINDYISKRETVFQKTYEDLYSITGDINDTMAALKIARPNAKNMVQSFHTKLNSIEKNINGAKFLKNDNILLRAYGKLLDNWSLELNCSSWFDRKKIVDFNMDMNTEVDRVKCREYEKSIARKRRERRKNNKHKEHA